MMRSRSDLRYIRLYFNPVISLVGSPMTPPLSLGGASLVHSRRVTRTDPVKCSVKKLHAVMNQYSGDTQLIDDFQIYVPRDIDCSNDIILIQLSQLKWFTQIKVSFFSFSFLKHNGIKMCFMTENTFCILPLCILSIIVYENRKIF